MNPNDITPWTPAVGVTRHAEPGNPFAKRAGMPPAQRRELNRRDLHTLLWGGVFFIASAVLTLSVVGGIRLLHLPSGVPAAPIVHVHDVAPGDMLCSTPGEVQLQRFLGHGPVFAVQCDADAGVYMWHAVGNVGP